MIKWSNHITINNQGRVPPRRPRVICLMLSKIITQLQVAMQLQPQQRQQPFTTTSKVLRHSGGTMVAVSSPHSPAIADHNRLDLRQQQPPTATTTPITCNNECPIRVTCQRRQQLLLLEQLPIANRAFCCLFHPSKRLTRKRV